MSHMDVVPVEKEDADRGKDLGWSHAPFGGSVAEGFVWGRGTMDVKFSLISILEAVEGLLGTG